MARLPSPVKNLAPAQSAYLLASLLVSGASTLILEIVGTRVIAPYYGSSLYCWSALITVTLLALAAGYALGGRWADKRPYLTLFARLLCLAGVAVAMVPSLRMPVLQATTPLGVQGGACASALILVAPALVFLSALGPLAIKLRTEAMASVGRSAGDLFAVSTAGSVAGAALAGFVLIPSLPLSQILFGLACLLLALGALGYHLSKERSSMPYLAAAGAAAAALVGFWPRAAPNTNVQTRESAYGQIKILDTETHRYLLINGTAQSMAALPSLEGVSPVAVGLEFAAVARPAPRALVVGLGAGLLSGALERHHGAVVDSVEVDPAVVETAETQFGYRPNGMIFKEDGRAFLERTSSRYGLLFVDAFGAEQPPYQLFTLESFRRMKEVLEPGGVLALNLGVGELTGSGAAWPSAYKTLKELFREVRAYRAGDADGGIGNVLVFCSEAPLNADAARKARPEIRDALKTMLTQELVPTADQLDAATLLTDDHAPLEYLVARAAVRWRRVLQEKIPTVLLY